MRDILQGFSTLLIVLADGAWIVHVAERSDYNEAALLLAGAAGLAAMACVRWRGAFPVRAAGIAAVALLAVFFGDAAKRVHVQETAYRDAVTRAVMAEVAAKVRVVVDETGDSPDCAYPGVAEVLAKRGIDPAVRVRGARGLERAWETLPTKDAWRARFEYVKTSKTGFLLRSSGADRRFNTPDDIIRFGDALDVPTAPSITTPPYPGWPAALNSMMLGLYFRPV